MKVQHNLPALNANRQLGANNKTTSKNLEKLSSGFRVNRSADDAAGLGISEKMRGQIRGLTKAMDNINEGINLTQTIDGAMSSDHSMLQRMRELLVQAANGTYADDDRKVLQKEVDHLIKEIDDLSYRAEYNKIRVLRGDVRGLPDWAELFVTENNKMIDDSYINPATGLAHTAARVDFSPFTPAKAIDLVDCGFNDTCCTCTSNRFSIKFNDDGDNSVTKENVLGVTSYVLNVDIFGVTSGEELVKRIVNLANRPLPDAPSDTFNNVHFTSLAVDPDNPGVLVIYDNRAGQSAPENGRQGEVIVGVWGNINTKKSPDIVIQAGANKGEQITVPITTVDSYSLGLRIPHGASNISVYPASAAADSINFVDDAIDILSGKRADIGAVQNRLESALNNVGNTRENLIASESSIRDLDMAKEMMEYTKNSILMQASQSMLAQANQLPQGILGLLR